MTLDELASDLVEKPAVAAALKTSTRTITRYEGEPDGLPFIKIGKRHMYRMSSVVAWLERREKQRNPRRRGRGAH